MIPYSIDPQAQILVSAILFLVFLLSGSAHISSNWDVISSKEKYGKKLARQGLSIIVVGIAFGVLGFYLVIPTLIVGLIACVLWILLQVGRSIWALFP